MWNKTIQITVKAAVVALLAVAVLTVLLTPTPDAAVPAVCDIKE